MVLQGHRPLQALLWIINMIPKVTEGVFTSKSSMGVDLVAHVLRKLLDELFPIALSFVTLNRSLGLLNGIHLLFQITSQDLKFLDIMPWVLAI